MAHFHHYEKVNLRGLNIAFFLTLTLFVAEIIGGLITNSLAILSDAWHLLTDILALSISWFALWQTKKPANRRLTYGYHRIGIFAAFINNLSLIGISFYIFYKAIYRLFNPVEVKSLGMVSLAILGVIVSGTIVLLLRKQEDNLNIKSATLHFIGDILSYIGVVIAGILLYFTNWLWIDPVISIIFAAIILNSAFRMLVPAVKILLEAVPDSINLEDIEKTIIEIPGVKSVHDIHVWGISLEEIMLTAHIVVDNTSISEGHNLIHDVKNNLYKRYKIWHVILQLET